MKIGILMGGPSAERNISLKTGKAVASACRELGHEIMELSFRANYKKFLPLLRSTDLVFNALHGTVGEDGIVQAWLDKNNIKYTGSGAGASSLCMNKDKSKNVARSLGLLTPNWEIIHSIDDVISLNAPLVIKPNDQGSTIGLSVVRNINGKSDAINHAMQYSDYIIAEQFVRGREITVAILGENVLPIVEIRSGHELYDYESKYTPGMSKYVCPAELGQYLTIEIQKNTKKLFKALECKVYGRADYLLDKEGKCFFLEMNTLPGMTSTSLVPIAAKANGLSFKKLIDCILEMSL